MKGVKARPRGGFSFVEFLIVLSTAAILLPGVDTWMQNYEVRSRVAEALVVAETARTNILITCNADPRIAEINQEAIAHRFPSSDFVESIEISGPCSLPQITLRTRNTGLPEDPTIVVWTDLTRDTVTWNCSSTSKDRDVPSRCRQE
jgi:hypothetical protein